MCEDRLGYYSWQDRAPLNLSFEGFQNTFPTKRILNAVLWLLKFNVNSYLKHDDLLQLSLTNRPSGNDYFFSFASTVVLVHNLLILWELEKCER